jgi:TIR domain
VKIRHAISAQWRNVAEQSLAHEPLLVFNSDADQGEAGSFRMRMRTSLLLLCATGLPLTAASQEASRNWVDAEVTLADVLRVIPIGTVLTVVVAYVVLFKIFSRWPELERWLVGAALLALPPFATYVMGWFVHFTSDSPVRDTGGFWAVVALALGTAWWLLKNKTRFLDSPAAAGEFTRSRFPATLKKESVSASPVEPSAPAPESAAPEPAPSAQPSRRKEAASQTTAAMPAPSAPVARDAIFISYRRQDSADVTGRIYDRLVQRFGREQIFKDVDSIPLGVDFRVHLGNVVGRCNFVLAVIGPQWMSASGPNGRRLEDKGDFVRVEIESALARDIPVIPILVGGASLPSDTELPPSLGAITFRNGIRVRPDPDFHRDMDRLIAGLEQHGHG